MQIVTDRVDYDEFGLFGENAAEYGLPFDHPPAVRRVFDVATALISGSAATASRRTLHFLTQHHSNL